MNQNENLREIYKQYQASQDKYTYFLLAAAGASVGFAIQKTDGMLLSWWLIPIGFACLCWGLSFYFGCKNITWVQSALYQDYELNQLQGGIHPEQPLSLQQSEVAVSMVSKAMSSCAAKAQFYGIWQFRTLIIGAVFLISWRITEMVRLTVF